MNSRGLLASWHQHFRDVTLTILASFGLILLGSVAAQAQVAAPPENPAIDSHQVNLPTGEVVMQRPIVAIGPSSHRGLSFSEIWVDDGWRYAELPTLSGSTDLVVVSAFGLTTVFEKDGNGDYSSTFDRGATLVFSINGGSQSTYTYTTSDGMEIVYGQLFYNENYQPADSGLGFPISATFPDGVIWDFHYLADGIFSGESIFDHRRLESITTNTGFQIKLDYQVDTLSSATSPDWHELISVTAINNAVEYCAPVGDCAGLTGNWPTATFANGDITDVAGDTTDYEYNGPGGRITSITRPGGVNPTVQIAYDAQDRVDTVSSGTGTWSYDYTSTRTTVTNPENGVTWVDYTSNDLVTARRVENQEVTYAYCDGSVTSCPEGLLASVETPEGQTTSYQYDARGNVTQVVSTDRNDANPITTSASYAANCTNPVTCNRPLSMTDAAGQITNYTYDPTHGGVTLVEAPAASAGAPRATVIQEYTTAQARYRDSSSTYTTSDPVTVLHRTRSCRTAATCSGTTDEVVVEVSYPSANDPNNLQPLSVTNKLGNGGSAATTAFTYTDLGRPESVDGPVPGADDTSFVVYDAYGRRIGSVSGDPDGTGPMPRLASRVVFQDGLVMRSERGTSSTTADLSGFVADQRQDIEYDDIGRPIIQRHRDVAGNTQHRVIQASYNALGLVECTALRMDAADVTTTLPSSACSITAAGLNGSDRISRTVYDDYGRVIERRSAVGTTLEQVTQRFSYRTGFSQNGQLGWVEDAEGNRTRYRYDAYGRHFSTRYPDPVTPNTENSGDNELVLFDAYGRIASFRNRSGRFQHFSRDNLGRITEVNDTGRTGLDATHSRNTYYGYDLFGNLEYARFDSATGEGITNSWNALGQLLNTTNDMDGTARTLNYFYDTARRRDRIQHPDGTNFYYNFDPLGRLTSINRAGQSALWEWDYTSEGRMASRSAMLDAPDVSYGFDSAGRLDQMMIDHPTNNTYDATHDFTFNPAGQVTSEALDNAMFAFGDHTDNDLTFAANGLNQYVSVTDNAATPNPTVTNYTYDASGNFTSDGTTLWTYDNNNRLVVAVDVETGNEQTIVRYDPLGRMYELSYDDDITDDPLIAGNEQSIRRLYYDGHDLVLEYDGDGTAVEPMLARYVHGVSGGDDPLVQYDGPSTLIGNAQFLYTDRLGSVIAMYNRWGTLTQVNAYDAFGTPDADNGGRFQYTGQQYVPELGLYYYKARFYSPRQGRFMQTDPIGYADGMNMYAYVGNDPVNWVDPTGLARWYRVGDNICVDWETTIVDPDTGEETPQTTGTYCEYDPLPEFDNFYQPNIPTWLQETGGGRIVITAERLTDEEKCDLALTERGVVFVYSNTASFHILAGITGSIGHWRNESTGTHGKFFSLGGGLGGGGGVSVQVGYFNDLAGFVGGSASLNVSAGIVELTSSNAMERGNTGGGGMAGVGLGVGASFDLTGTAIYDCEFE